MKKPPAFQFYAKDFLSDMNVVIMTLEERGAYITLLSHLWIQGWLPNGSTKLKRLCDSPSNWNEIWNNIKHCFYENGTKIYHKRLDEEKEKQRLWREKSRDGGIKSGESRREQKELKGASTNNKEPNEPNSNSSLTSSSSSSSLSDTSIKNKEVIAPKDKNPSKPKSIYFNFDNSEWENIPDSKTKLWKEAYPACDIEIELKKMAVWLIENPTKRKKNYGSFIVRWLTKTQDRGGTKIGTNKKSAIQSRIDELKEKQNVNNK